MTATGHIVLLGPQRFDPTVAEAAGKLGILSAPGHGQGADAAQASGRIAIITAGWQERESDDADLHSHLGHNAVNLRLHQRSEEVFQRDPELHAAYRARQDRYRQLQDFYRIRLDYALEAARVIGHRVAPKELLEEEQRSSIEAIRSLDRHHLRQCQEVGNEFAEHWRPHERDAVAQHRQEIAAELGDCVAVAIAGGHVASLLNRLKLFAIVSLISTRPVLAWSGGAMVLSEQVVLFHDSPPQGQGAPEILDAGLGLVRGILPLPNPEMRLRTDEPDRMALAYVRRFAPMRCLVLPSSAYVAYHNGVLRHAHGVALLGHNGDRVPLENA